MPSTPVEYVDADSEEMVKEEVISNLLQIEEMEDRESIAVAGTSIKQEAESDEEVLEPLAFMLEPKQELIEGEFTAGSSLAHSTSQEPLGSQSCVSPSVRNALGSLSNEEDDICVGETIKKSIPAKSADKYDKEFQLFCDWKKENKVQNVDEHAMLAYMRDLSERVASSSLWAKYSMVKTMLLVQENLDISSFSKVKAFLKKQSIGYQPRPSKTFTRDEIIRFMKDAFDEEYLLTKVVALIGITGGCRREELHSMSVDDIKDVGSQLIISVPHTKISRRRMFSITNDMEGVNSIEIIRKYVALRPKKLSHRMLFMGYRYGKCIAQRAGIHYIGGMPKKMAEFLGLSNPEMYTGHSFRRTFAKLIMNKGINRVLLKSQKEWTNPLSENCVEYVIGEKQKEDSASQRGEDFTVSTQKEQMEISTTSSLNDNDIIPAVEFQVPTYSKREDDTIREKHEVSAKLQTGEYVILKKGRSRSKVWEKFASVYDSIKKRYVGYVQCTGCTLLFSMKLGAGTTHLSRHVCKTNNESAVTPIFKRLDSQALRVCEEKCVSMCISDVTLPSVISRKGFLDLGQELIKIGAVHGNVNILSVLPSTAALSHHISEVAQHVRRTVLQDVQRAIREGVCAMEVWTEKIHDMIKILVTCQYVADDWSLCRQVLFTCWCFWKADGSEARLIEEEVKMKLCSLGISFSEEDRKKCTFVMNRPMLLRDDLICAAYSFGSVVKAATAECFLTHNCPEIWGCVCAGKNILDFLKTKGLIRHLDKHTRFPYWSSAVFILETVFYNFEYIVQTLSEMKEERYLSNWNTQLVSEFMIFLTKFQETFNDMQTRAYPTLHLFLVYIYELGHHCDEKSSDHPDIAHIKAQAKHHLEEIDVNQKHYIATFLCPHTRLLKQLSPDMKTMVHDFVRNMCMEVNTQSPSTSDNPSPQKKSRFGAWIQNEDDQDCSLDEVALYLAAGKQESEDPGDLLSWWQGKAKLFPRLSQVARKVLCIPATCSSYNLTSGQMTPCSIERFDLSCEQESDLLLIHNKAKAEGPCSQIGNSLEESTSQSM